MGSITPIRGGAGGPSAPKAKRSQWKKTPRLEMIDRVEGEGFTTLDMVNGLRGVCSVMDRLAADETNSDLLADLAQAAKSLSAMIASRVD